LLQTIFGARQDGAFTTLINTRKRRPYKEIARQIIIIQLCFTQTNISVGRSRGMILKLMGVAAVHL